MIFGLLVLHSHSEPPVEKKEAPAASPAVSEIKRRLDEMIRSDTARRNAVEPEWIEKSLAERLEEHFSQLAESKRKDQAVLAELLGRSGAFRNVPDLRVPLADALITDDSFPNDSFTEAAAIFLEWHRRDPRQAFDEMARRPVWLKTFIFHDELFLHLSLEEVAGQLSVRHRPADFQNTLLDGLGKRLAHAGDLAGLVSTMAMLETPAPANQDAPADHWGNPRLIQRAPMPDKLVAKFVSATWVPRDGAAASEAIRRMPEAGRKALLMAVAASSNLTFAWAEGAGKPLMEETLGAAEVERIGKQASDFWEMIRSGADHSGGRDEDDEYSDREISRIESGLSPDDADSALSEGLSLALSQEKDYAELFAAGKISIDEIQAAMTRKIPGAEAYQGVLSRALYKKLAPYDLPAAAAWAETRLSAEDLAAATCSILQYSEEPRASRLAEMIRELPSDLPVDDDMFVDSIRKAFRDWKALDPEAAAAAAASIPKNHPLREAANGGEDPDENEP